MSEQNIVVTNLATNNVLEVTKENRLGQYFTTNNVLKEKLYSFILNKPNNILEPSIGQGDLISFITEKLSNINFDMYEIDKEIILLDGLEQKKSKVIYGDFMVQEITKKYKTIIGNPPYIRTKTKRNIYIDFTEKCYNLLDNNGELVFIVPSDFLKLTSASKLLDEMMLNGSFTHIYHPHNEKLFVNASIDVIVFRYCKNILLEKKVEYNEKIMYITNSSGLITFSEEQPINTIMFKDKFDIYVGIVSGRDEIYKNNSLGNIEVLNGKDKKEKFIYIEKYPCDNNDINKYLLGHKDTLLKRGIKKFTETNWFQWGAPRNITSINEYMNKDCIYIYNLTRRDEIAFIGKVGYFGGSLLMLKPKGNCDLKKIVSYLNSVKFRKNFIFANRFKIGHRQLCNSYIPDDYV